MDATPEVRKDKVAMLKKAITEGTYQVKVGHIAGKIVKEVFFELLLTFNQSHCRGCSNN